MIVCVDLFVPHKCPDDLLRALPKNLRKLDQLEHVEPTFAAFVLCNETLRSPEPLELGDELLRLRARAARQKRRIASSSEAWAHWSATLNQAMNLVGRISATPATDFVGLAIKFDAILWAIEHNDSLLDLGDGRQLRQFARDLHRLAGNAIPGR